VLPVLGVLVILFTTPCRSAVVCVDGYQQNPDGPIRTPYCEYNYLAQVAADHGMRVTGDKLRQDYGAFRDVWGGHLQRFASVRNLCASHTKEAMSRGRLLLDVDGASLPDPSHRTRPSSATALTAGHCYSAWSIIGSSPVLH
jgi:hypothetical protein